MPEKPIRLAVIVGSVREGRFGPTIARWFADQARPHEDLNLDIIDLAEIRLPMVLRLSGPSRRRRRHEP
ncbi:NADPH-dependent FMN reductase [Streptosporangium lutulentum]